MLFRERILLESGGARRLVVKCLGHIVRDKAKRLEDKCHMTSLALDVLGCNISALVL